MHPPKKVLNFPFLTGEQIQKVESLAAAQYGLTHSMLMENAGLALAMWIRQAAAGQLADRRILIIAGSGNNGGDGLVAARWLATWGSQIAVALIKPAASYSQLFFRNFECFDRLNVPYRHISEFDFFESAKASDLIVDCLLGTGTKPESNDLISAAIDQINRSKVPVISADIPSGLNGDDGASFSQIVAAHTTVSFAVPKLGFLVEGAKVKIGQLVLADIGLAPALFTQIGITFPHVFIGSGFVKVDLGQFQTIKQKVTTG